MKVQDISLFIESEFAKITKEASIRSCIKLLEKEQLNCIAVVDNNRYVGSIHIEDLEGLDIQAQLSDYMYLFRNCSLVNTSSTVDFLKQFVELETQQLIVVNQNHEIAGSLSLNDFFAFLRETPFLAFSAEEIVLQKKREDFTYAEVAQIIESHNAKLVGIFTQYVDSNLIQISVRLDHNGINEILQSLRRYDYEIISLHEEDKLTEKLKDYSDYFNKFLNI